jgi:hypothetical protein
MDGSLESDDVQLLEEYELRGKLHTAWQEDWDNPYVLVHAPLNESPNLQHLPFLYPVGTEKYRRRPRRANRGRKAVLDPRSWLEVFDIYPWRNAVAAQQPANF